MKTLFYAGVVLLGIFEILNVYFIMPMPGSQRMDSIDLAYFLYTNRWTFRAVFGLMIIAGALTVFRSGRIWIPLIAMLPVAAVVYFFNFKMTADHMFLQPEVLAFKSKSENVLNDSSIVIAVRNKYDAKAYPVRYIQYHHQVRDSIGGELIMVTYCNVCRTGRVFRPLVDGSPENFRLVGMDHFNAMFEDSSTKSWWRQATGEAVTGTLKGKSLPEVESSQMTLGKFFLLHPYGRVMDAEARSKQFYDTLGRYEKGKSRGDLTRTDSSSWKDKSWVVGVQLGSLSKAYDWNDLKRDRVINDSIGTTPITIGLAGDDQTFIVIERTPDERFVVRNDTLISTLRRIDFAGRSNEGYRTKVINSYQEFWHSWKEFHPGTAVYKAY